MQISITSPQNYHIGAFHAHVVLRPNEIPEGLPREYPFALPRLEARRISPDGAKYRSAPRNHAHGFDGMLVDGEWHGDIYSNGCAEADNPTSIEVVRDELRRALRTALSV